MQRMIRSAGAVVGGVVAMAALSTFTDTIMHATGVFPPAGEPMVASLWGLATLYRAFFAIASGFITARLAPDREVAHAVGLGFVGIGLSLAGAAATWNGGPGYGPHWYSLALVAIALPCSWAGGRLYAVSRGTRAPAPHPGSRTTSATGI